MQNEGNVSRAREFYFKNKPTNLYFLLKERYEWMNPYLVGLKSVIELGSGAGFAREFIKNPHLKLTDVESHPWIDETVDALHLPYEDGALDAIICNQVIHHFARPIVFLREARRVLKPNGMLLAQEPYASFLLRFLLRIMKQEGWSYDVNVFSENGLANDPKDPWSGNNAIPQLLFRDPERFSDCVPGLRIEMQERGECLLFPISGGVTSRTRTIRLPLWALQWVRQVDRFLVGLFPELLALGIRVVIRKTQ